MRYEINNNSILLKFPAKNKGKFRFKKRQNKIGFGKSFSTRKEKFDDTVYLEWQIGYDVPVNDINDKNTKLTKKSFKGSNGKEKYPYELSEIFFEAIKLKLFAPNVIDKLKKQINSYKNFIDENSISLGHEKKITLNDISFQEAPINLPTFFYFCPDGTQIEISIQKQQYATGVQPMIYFCIPFHCFKNYKNLMNNSSDIRDELIYEINRKNKKNLILLFKIFGMASQRHKNDILEILKLLKVLIMEK